MFTTLMSQYSLYASQIDYKMSGNLTLLKDPGYKMQYLLRKCYRCVILVSLCNNLGFCSKERKSTIYCLQLYDARTNGRTICIPRVNIAVIVPLTRQVSGTSNINDIALRFSWIICIKHHPQTSISHLYEVADMTRGKVFV